MKFSFSNFISVISVLCFAFASIKGDADKPKNKVKDIGTEELIVYLGNPNALIIDIRSPKELCKTGTFFAAINIPANDVKKALGSTSSTKFFFRYGHIKPRKCTPIVFTCESGKRSADAAKIAADLGYTNILIYKDGWKGWLEYAKKHQPKYNCIPESFLTSHECFLF